MFDLGVVNAYAVRVKSGFALIDTGPPGADAAILDAVGRLADAVAVQQVVLTHSHKDHAGSAAAVVARTGATVCAGVADAPVMAPSERVCVLNHETAVDQQAFTAM